MEESEYEDEIKSNDKITQPQKKIAKTDKKEKGETVVTFTINKSSSSSSSNDSNIGENLSSEHDATSKEDALISQQHTSTGDGHDASPIKFTFSVNKQQESTRDEQDSDKDTKSEQKESEMEEERKEEEKDGRKKEEKKKKGKNNKQFENEEENEKEPIKKENDVTIKRNEIENQEGKDSHEKSFDQQQSQQYLSTLATTSEQNSERKAKDQIVSKIEQSVPTDEERQSNSDDIQQANADDSSSSKIKEESEQREGMEQGQVDYASISIFSSSANSSQGTTSERKSSSQEYTTSLTTGAQSKENRIGLSNSLPEPPVHAIQQHKSIASPSTPNATASRFANEEQVIGILPQTYTDKTMEEQEALQRREVMMAEAVDKTAGSQCTSLEAATSGLETATCSLLDSKTEPEMQCYRQLNSIQSTDKQESQESHAGLSTNNLSSFPLSTSTTAAAAAATKTIKSESASLPIAGTTATSFDLELPAEQHGAKGAAQLSSFLTSTQSEDTITQNKQSIKDAGTVQTKSTDVKTDDVSLSSLDTTVEFVDATTVAASTAQENKAINELTKEVVLLLPTETVLESKAQNGRAQHKSSTVHDRQQSHIKSDTKIAHSNTEQKIKAEKPSDSKSSVLYSELNSIQSSILSGNPETILSRLYALSNIEDPHEKGLLRFSIEKTLIGKTIRSVNGPHMVFLGIHALNIFFILSISFHHLLFFFFFFF